MTISTNLNVRALLDAYETATPNERACVDACVTRILDTFERHGFEYSTDDRLAEIEAVIFNFMRESN